MERRLPLAGWLLFLSILAALGSGYLGLSPLPAGLLQLAVAVLLFGRVSRMVRVQSLLLAAAGVAALLAAGVRGEALLTAWCRNQAMIAMLAAVGFLRLVPLSPTAGALPTGRRALWQTLFGVHWLGAVTNLSAVVLFGDRMAAPASRLEQTQAVVLLRGFALAALWSPFFVAMGVALSQAPGARLGPILLWGLPLSHLLMALLAWRLGKRSEPLPFAGYPFNLATIGGPLLLALAVIGAHLLAPRLAIVSLVTLAAPAYALFASRRRQPWERSAEYIRRDLPRMGPEVILFIAAGVLGAGFTALVGQHAAALPAAGSGPLAAAVGLAVILLLAAAGIHPIAGITAVGAVLSHAGLPPDLLALSFLMGWGLGVIISPISGSNLLLAGRYGVAQGRVWRWHTPFVAGAYLLCCGWLFVFSALS